MMEIREDFFLLGATIYSYQVLFSFLVILEEDSDSELKCQIVC